MLSALRADRILIEVSRGHETSLSDDPVSATRDSMAGDTVKLIEGFASHKVL
jgi:hypothetical protein